MKNLTLILCLALTPVLFTNCKKDDLKLEKKKDFKVLINHKYEQNTLKGWVNIYNTNIPVFGWDVISDENYSFDCNSGETVDLKQHPAVVTVHKSTATTATMNWTSTSTYRTDKFDLSATLDGPSVTGVIEYKPDCRATITVEIKRNN